MSQLHQQIMDAAYSRWQAQQNMSQEQFWSTLNPIDKLAVLTGNLNYQVENGGFTQWWGNRYATKANVEFLVRACETMNTRASLVVKDLLDEFRRILVGADCRPDEWYKGALSSETSDEWDFVCAALNNLDGRYYAVNATFMADVEERLQRAQKESTP